MRHLDLFSGIGGFALAARNVWGDEYENVGFVEIDTFCHKVLMKNFDNAVIHNDVKTFNGRELNGIIDLITAGTPCQPSSQAGKRRGKADDRWLWGETFRIIGDVKPTWFIIENVSGLFTLEKGLVFDELLSDMEALGYEVQAFRIPACAVNAPHRRDRWWFVAHTKSAGERRIERDVREEECGSRGTLLQRIDSADSGHGLAPHNAFSAHWKYNRESEERQGAESGKSYGDVDAEDSRREHGTWTENEGEFAGTIGQGNATESERSIGCGEHGIAENSAEQGLQESEVEGGIREENRGRETGIAGRPDSAFADPDSCYPGFHANGTTDWSAHWLPVAQRFCQFPYGVPFELARCLRDEHISITMGFILTIRDYYAEKDDGRRKEILYSMRDTIEKKEIQKFHGRLHSFLEKEVLRCRVHGGINDKEEPASRFSKKKDKKISNDRGGEMFAVRDSGEPSHPSCRHESKEQCTCEFDDIVRWMSSEVALESWSCKAKKACEDLFNMWERYAGEGILSEPLQALHKIWESIADKEVRFSAARSDIRNRDRAKKLKALGNSIVPQVAEQIFRAIKYAEGNQ